MNLKTKTKKLIACCWIFLSVNQNQNLDSIRIDKAFTQTKTSVDSAKWYAQKMQEVLRELKLKMDNQKQNPH